ncbi:MAG: hypothetical protein LBC63_07165 [Holophagales bacterium]|jgi:hypothetical protein|nr:hypothetical protein [Holophagales bacterium]
MFFSLVPNMKMMFFIALPCVLLAEPPLTLGDVLARSKVPIQKLLVDSALADGQLLVNSSAGFLRESPTISVSAGPRMASGASSTTDQTIEMEAGLLLNRGPRKKLASDINSSAPILYSAADLENRLAIHQAFLYAWLAERVESIRAEDHSIVSAWLEIAKARSESGADPAFQLELAKGELLKSRMDLGEAKLARIQAWAALKALAELPDEPQPLDYLPQALVYDSANAQELEAKYQKGAIRRSVIAKQGLEVGQANVQAALANSRWSIASSYSKESIDRIAKIGIAYKFPSPKETSAIKANERARVEASRRSAEIALSELDMRFRSAMQSSQGYAGAHLGTPDTDASLEALTLRLQEGKDRPSEAIPIRRQFLEIKLAELQRHCALYLADAELRTLIAEDKK